jgi:hypothetical protein
LWAYDSRTRGFENVRTGERISRRQVDKLYGTLADEGFTSYEAKAKSRRAMGLAGFRRVGTTDVYERVVDSARERKAILRTLPPNARVRVLVGGTVHHGVSGASGTNAWRTMNFPPTARGTAPVQAHELLDVWDRWASRSSRSTEITNARRWLFRVYR